jgi:hypothetical protein
LARWSDNNHHHDCGNKDDDDDDSDAARPHKKRRTTNRHHWHERLRLKRTSFANNLQLLNEILQIASVDAIPILFVLDELDACLVGGTTNDTTTTTTTTTTSSQPEHERQVLMYHLLDRVATAGSYVSLVAISDNVTTVRGLEKRLQSRAMGTATSIQFGPMPCFDTVVRVLIGKLDTAPTGGGGGPTTTTTLWHQHYVDLKDQVYRVLRHDDAGTGTTIDNDDSDDEESKRQVYLVQTLVRDYRFGKDMRWFCRVLAYALTLYRLECRQQRDRVVSMAATTTTAAAFDDLEATTKPATTNKSSVVVVPKFGTKHFMEAMGDMGASFGTDSSAAASDLDPRRQALYDASGAAVVLLVSARRILARDGQRESSYPHPSLTLQRMVEEYHTYKGGSSRYSDHVLTTKAFTELLESGVVRPGRDNVGTTPYQYRHEDAIYSMDLNSMMRMPLQLTVDIISELKPALDNNRLRCSTALREWGRKTN